jgi:hypothetical protein
MPKFERYTKYEVIKLDDIKKFLNSDQKAILSGIIETIKEGRKADGKVPCNNYVVVNEDEPYAEIVWKLIQSQWERDKLDKKD